LPSLPNGWREGREVGGPATAGILCRAANARRGVRPGWRRECMVRDAPTPLLPVPSLLNSLCVR